jgi:glycosyltransferase involved in cell wall biosynthesis
MFMGRVIWGKGISLAVEVANYCNKKLIICGSGDIDKAIPEQISKKNIEYLGVVNFEEKTKLLSKASAFICPSLYVEPFGHVVPEASLAGTPVISTDFGAFTETVRHGITGFRCKVFKDYINAVTALSDIMPANCRKFAVENFSIQAVYPKYYDYFLNIIKLKTTNEG